MRKNPSPPGPKSIPGAVATPASSSSRPDSDKESVAPRPRIGEDVEGAGGLARDSQTDLSQRGHEVGPALVVGRPHRGDVVLRLRERCDAGHLYEVVGAQEEVLLDLLARANELLRRDEVAETPTRHRVGLREPVQHERPVGVLEDAVGALHEVQTVVDLVAHDPDTCLLGDGRELAEVLLAEHRAHRIRRRVDDDAARARRDGGPHLVRPETERVLGTHRHRHGHSAEECDVVGIRRIAGVRDDDLVARIEQGAEEQQHRRRRALAHDDVLGVDVDAVRGIEVERYGLAQARQAERLRVAGVAVLHRLLGGVLDDVGGGQVRIADLQTDDVAPFGLEFLGAGHDVHDDEGPNELGAARNVGQERPPSGARAALDERAL